CRACARCCCRHRRTSRPRPRPRPTRTPAPTATTAPCWRLRSRPSSAPSRCRRRHCRRYFAHRPPPSPARSRILAAWVRAVRPQIPETRASIHSFALSFFQESSMSTFTVATPRASCLAMAIMAVLLLPCPASGQEAGITQLKTIEVEGHLDSVESEQALTPGNVSIVDGESFHERAVNNMADSLRYVP